MHAYVITAKPGRWQRFVRAARTCTVRLLVGVGLAVLGLLVLAVRILRPLVNLLATLAVRVEVEISLRTGLPAVGATLGAGLTAAFTREFRTAWTTPTTEYERTTR